MNRMANALLPDLRLPFGILVAIVLGAASVFAGDLLNVDLRYLTQIGIGALIAVDLHRRPLTPYDTIFAMGPFASGIMSALAWPLLLPWYMSTRSRETRGGLPPRKPSGQRLWIGAATGRHRRARPSDGRIVAAPCERDIRGSIDAFDRGYGRCR